MTKIHLILYQIFVEILEKQKMTFSHKFNAHYGYNLGLYPLDWKDLNWEIIFENGILLNFSYIFIATYEIENIKENKLETIEQKSNINNFLFNEYLNQKKFDKSKKLINNSFEFLLF